MPAHRKRGSVLRLSSDTTHSLPVYVPDADDIPDDRPPDYPEADEETDSSSSAVYVPPPPPSSFSLSSPRRRRHQQRRRQSTPLKSTDPYLDSLLARSVHALEMSNTLLQSSMSTQTALSTIFADSQAADEGLESRARGLSMRIERRDHAQPKWADDLAEISRGVDGLLQEEMPSSVSCSLPTASSPMKHAQRHRRRPSMLELGDGRAQARSDLVAPPPRTSTQYVGSNDLGSSTLGASSLHAPLSSPKVTETLPEPATPAYNMLSSFVNHRRPPSASTSTSTSTSSTPAARSSPLPALPSFFSRRGSASSSSSSPRRKIDQLSTSPTTPSKAKSKPDTPKHTHHRPMTPPAEESCSSSSSSSSDSDCLAKRTVLSLRKILDEQPPPPQPKPQPQPHRLRAPAFMPRTPAPVAEAGTSTATASISRLYTKSKHTSSTRPPSPPRQSAMKQQHAGSQSQSQSQSQRQLPLTPTSNPDSPTAHWNWNWSWSSASLGKGVGSSSSGTSTPTPTPKRISFAELPESYRGETSVRFARRRNGRGGGRRRDREGEGDGAWWGAWLWGGGGGGGMSGSGREERLGRSWGARMPGAPVGFGPGMDEWGV